MRIVAMDVFPIELTLTEPIPMSSGVISSTGNVVMRLMSDDGIVGWGEGVEAPALTGQRQSDIVADLEALSDVVVGSDPTRLADSWLRTRRVLPTASTARGAIDMAMHDLVARSMGVPVHRLLGGLVRDRVPALVLVGSGDTSADLAKLEKYHAEGFNWFKIKLGIGSAEEELATLVAARELVSSDGVVCGDANEAWDERSAVEFLDNLAGTGVRFIEQPVSRTDPEALIRVAERSPVPICADEGAGSLEAVVALAGSAVSGVSLKLIKHGGIRGVMSGASVCATGGLDVNLAGKVIESSISAAANLHCAAAMEAIYYGCSPANRGVELDVTEDPVTPLDGEYLVPDGPGLGIEVDESILRHLVKKSGGSYSRYAI